MEKIPALFQVVVNELVETSKKVDEAQIDALVREIMGSKRVFVAGAGRSGFVARAFSNRLMHLGFTVYFVGDTTTPSIQSDDLLIISSGSGTTKGLVAMAQTAQSKGTPIATVTIFPDHTIGKMSKTVVQLYGTTNKFMDEGKEEKRAQPMGNVFEQLSFLVYDTVTTKIKEMTGQTEEQLSARHANLE